jgi:hypothetical protein
MWKKERRGRKKKKAGKRGQGVKGKGNVRKR